jgi:hypothetical protein
MIQSSIPETASSCSSASALHSEDHKHYKAFVPHLALFSTPGSRLDCSYGIDREALLSVHRLESHFA